LNREHFNSLASALDASGVLHRGKDYHAQTLPWMNDRTKTVAPDYPFAERRYHHEGTGIIRLTLDLKSGAVTRASVAKTTGFTALDASAISAFRQWRWKPGRWKEISLPVTFKLSNMSAPIPKEAALLPQP